MMSPAERQELEALRAEVADLRDRLSAYEAFEREDAEDGERARRVQWWAERFRQARPGDRHHRLAARALLLFLARPGRPIRKAAFGEALNTDAEMVGRLVDLVICELRKSLAVLGLGRDDVETLWGFGYRMPASAAARLAALEPGAAA